LSLYLKYRPQDFESLVGQGFIKDTLKKAIADKKTVGAYLFTGPRGTGKTSTARIFAKAINCTDNTDGNPCLKCDVCKDFSNGKLIDIIEIDAASHTGVDNIREIIEKAQFQPTKTQYKIYIIDEVHMLSKWAFNALLKILEEPPEHVKFILATTEIHKVPETILSRCQRYDFRNHTPEDTRERLQYIAKQEKVTIDEASLEYIVKTANGGLRNAISLFEQLIVDGKITYTHIEETLWVSKHEEIQSFADKLIQRDTSLMQEFETLESSWKNIKLFFHDVLLLLWDTAKTDMLAGKDISEVISALDILHDTYGKSKNSFDEALTFRIGVMKVLSNYTPSSVTTEKAEVPVVWKTDSHKVQDNPWMIPKDTTPSISTSEPDNTDVSEEPIVEQSESLFSNAQDVFTSEEPAFWTDIAPEKTSQKNTGDSNFEKDIFIAEVKKQGAKWAITMSLRGADFSLSGSTLTIACKTKIARNSLDTPEVWDVLHSALEAIGKADITLSIT